MWQGLKIGTKEIRTKPLGQVESWEGLARFFCMWWEELQKGTGRMEDVMSFCNFLISNWDSAQREMEAGGGEGLRNESKVVTRQLGLQAWVSVKMEKHSPFFQTIVHISIPGVGTHAPIHVIRVSWSAAHRLFKYSWQRPAKSDLCLPWVAIVEEKSVLWMLLVWWQGSC